MARIHLFWFFGLTMGCLLKGSAGAVEHVVGGSLGWRIPPNASFYQDWARSKTFAVGDKLVFPYTAGTHNVVQVPKEDFEKCTQDNAIDMHYSGPTVVALETPGTHYFYCGIGTHCDDGQKLSVDVPGGSGEANGTAGAAGAGDNSGSSVRRAGPWACLLVYLFHSLFV